MTGPYYQAKSIIEENDVAVFSSNYNLYGDLSWRVMETLRMLIDDRDNTKVEVYSVDEAFLDLGNIPNEKLFTAAAEIREKVEQWTGIKVSVGVAPSKVLCKLANRLAKKKKMKVNV